MNSSKPSIYTERSRFDFWRTPQWTIAVGAVVLLFMALALPVPAVEKSTSSDAWRDAPSLSATLVSLGRRFVWGELAMGALVLFASVIVGGGTAWSLLRSRNSSRRRVLALAFAERAIAKVCVRHTDVDCGVKVLRCGRGLSSIPRVALSMEAGQALEGERNRDPNHRTGLMQMLHECRSRVRSADVHGRGLHGRLRRELHRNAPG
jgi:hypothetical protein